MAQVRRLSASDVFKTRGVPGFTYVRRENGRFESLVEAAIDSPGSLCLLTGPSKSGKTTLYSTVATERHLEVIHVRCDASLTVSEVWKRALERVNFERITQRENERERKYGIEGKLQTDLGWKWLAKASAHLAPSLTKTTTEGEVRERVLSQPSLDHLLPILKELPVLLVVEEFHYLEPAVREQLFQQWKALVDEEVTVFVVGTTHHASEIALTNPDLVGRLMQIDLTTWHDDDLYRIAEEGLRHLRVGIPRDVIRTIVKESVGLPIVTQALCRRLLSNAGITSEFTSSTYFDILPSQMYSTFHDVAKSEYGGHFAAYDKLVRGSRAEEADYSVFECILAVFIIEEPAFSLPEEEINSRLDALRLLGATVPPKGTVLTRLRDLGRLQAELGCNLLEWSERQRRLHIVEPSFLFYLRWRLDRGRRPSAREVISELMARTS